MNALIVLLLTLPLPTTPQPQPHQPLVAFHGGRAAAMKPVFLLDTKRKPEISRLEKWDERTWIGAGAMLASNVYDYELTHQGIAHQQCFEANSQFDSHAAARAVVPGGSD